MFRLKQSVKESGARRKSSTPLQRSGELRVQRDVNELDVPSSMQVSFPDPDNLMNITLELCPEEGYYARGKFTFTLNVPQDYPHKPPKVKCQTKIYHPNIDLDGNVCLNILRQDWKPILTLSSVLFGLQLLFLEPNPDDPLNKDAAELLKKNASQFARNVNVSLRGGYVGDTYFPSALR